MYLWMDNTKNIKRLMDKFGTMEAILKIHATTTNCEALKHNGLPKLDCNLTMLNQSKN